MTRQTVFEAEPLERQQLLESILREMVANVLRLPLDSVDVQQPLNNMGLDSLMTLELINKIKEKIGHTLSLGDFLQGPTIKQLAGNIYEGLSETLLLQEEIRP
jgi:acyl carrier protein